MLATQHDYSFFPFLWSLTGVTELKTEQSKPGGMHVPTQIHSVCLRIAHLLPSFPLHLRKWEPEELITESSLWCDPGIPPQPELCNALCSLEGTSSLETCSVVPASVFLLCPWHHVRCCHGLHSTRLTSSGIYHPAIHENQAGIVTSE